MALSMLLLLVITGVSLVVGAVHLAGGSKTSQLLSDEDARGIFFFDFPGFECTKVVLASDHNVAILFNEKRANAGLVVVMGAHSLTRMLDADLLSSVTRSNNGWLWA